MEEREAQRLLAAVALLKRYGYEAINVRACVIPSSLGFPGLDGAAYEVTLGHEDTVLTSRRFISDDSLVRCPDSIDLIQETFHKTWLEVADELGRRLGVYA